MNIKQLEFIAPSQANPLGSVNLEIEIPVVYREGMKEVQESENVNVELSTETVELLQKVAESIVKDLTSK